MQVLLVTTYDNHGGAALACTRLAKSLAVHEFPIQPTIGALVPDGHTTVPLVTEHRETIEAMQRGLDDPEYGLPAHRSGATNTIFSLSPQSVPLFKDPAVQRAEVINLHWTAKFLNAWSIQQLVATKKPVVWTLHDMRPFTGGCHYSNGCDGFMLNCEYCPQLDSETCQLPEVVLSGKRKAFAAHCPVVVSPSRWLADQARKSSLFARSRIEHIPNSVDPAVFTAMDKSLARQRLGLDPHTPIVLFVAHDLTEERKGFIHLANALEMVGRNVDIPVQAIGLGQGRSVDNLNRSVPLATLGHVRETERMELLYAAADMFVIPTLEDNLPNTVLEAMSCGTAVVGFSSGGVPEMVTHGVTGLLAPAGDTKRLAAHIGTLLTDTQMNRSMGQAGRKVILQHFTPQLQASRYSTLFRELVATPTSIIPPALHGVDLRTIPIVDTMIRSGQEATRQRQLLEHAADNLTEKAYAACRAKDEDLALELAAQLLELCADTSRHVEALRTQGSILAQLGHFSQAVDCFDLALMLEPFRHDIYLNISDVFRYGNLLDAADLALDQLEAANPLHPGLWVKRAQVAAAMPTHLGRDTAREMATRELKLHKTPLAQTILNDLDASS